MVLITGTPTYGKTAALKGYGEIVLPDDYVEDVASGVMDDSYKDPFRAQEDEHASWLRLAPENIQGFILKKGINEVTQGSRIEKVYRKWLLRRTYASRIPLETGKIIADEMPFLETKAVILKITPGEMESHSYLHNSALANLTQPANEKDGEPTQVIFDMIEYRKLCHLALSSKLGFSLSTLLRTSTSFDEIRHIPCATYAIKSMMMLLKLVLLWINLADLLKN